MKSWPFPFKDFSFQARLLLSIALATAIPFSLFLALSFLVDWGLPALSSVFLLLMFFVLTTVLVLLLCRRIVSPLQKFIIQIEAAHSDLLRGRKAGFGLQILQDYASRMDDRLKREKDQTRKLRCRLVALSAITAAMNQSVEAGQALNEVLGAVLEVSGFDGGMVFLRRGKEDSWDIRAWRGLQLDDMWGAEQVEVGQRILCEAARRRRIIFISDLQEDQQLQIQEFRDKGIRTVLAVPFVARGQVCGAGVLVSLEPRETSLEENELLETVGRQLGMAISDANLVSEWNAKSQDLSMLVESCSAFCTSLNPEEILSTASEKILKTLDAEFCHTAVADADGVHLVFETFASVHQTVSPVRPGEKIRMDQLPLCQKVVTNDQMIRIRGKGQLATSEHRLLLPTEVREVLLIPLSTGEKAIGMIGVGLRRPEKLDPGKLELGRSIVRHAASALRQAQVYQKVQEKADELSSLYHIAQKLSSILDRDELLEEILKVVVESFGYLNLAILLVDPKKHELYLKAAHGFPDETIKNSRIKIAEEGITGWVARTGQPLVVGDVKKDPRYVMGIRECRSEVAIPIKFKGEIIGVLDAESDRLFAFGQKDVRLLSQLASHTAVMLENSRLFSGERRKYLQLALINDVARKVVSTLNLDKLLTGVIEAIQLSFKYDHVSLFLLDDSAGDFVLKTCCGNQCESVGPGFRLKRGVGVVGRAGESGKSVVCNDVTSDPGYVPAIAGTRSEICVPIRKGKQVLGVLDVQTSAEDSFDDQDGAVLETVTDLLATAIDNARVYEEAKAKAHRLELTDQINRAINSTLNVKEIFNIVSIELRKVLDYDRISLSFWYPEKRLFELKMNFCPDAGLSAEGVKRIPADETNMFSVIQTEKPFYQAKLSLKAALKPMDRLIYSEGMRSYVYVPVMANGMVIAVLALESREKRGFDRYQIEFLESVGAHLSVAIQNAGLFSDLETAYQNLKKTQEEMLQIERFRALGEMAGGVVHDFNNILASIQGRAQLILMKLKSEECSLSGEIERSLSVIEDSAADGAVILGRIREFTKAKLEAAFRSTDINRVVQDSLALTHAHWKNKAAQSGISIKVVKNLQATRGVWGDEAELRELVTNLVLNAMDAMPRGGTLSLRTEDDEDSVLLTVGDTGVGMTDEVKSSIFTPFFTTKGEQGTGLGLSLARGIVTRHKGEIRVESHPGTGTTFTITIPGCLPEPDNPAPRTSRDQSASVLVVEDEENIREVLEEILSAAGHEVAQASSGEEGIELFKKHRQDLVITDLGLPGLSGWEVASAVKNENPSTPVVLFTGWGVKLDQEQAKRKSIDRFINKPFNMEQILSLVSELLAQKEEQNSSA